MFHLGFSRAWFRLSARLAVAKQPNHSIRHFVVFASHAASIGSTPRGMPANKKGPFLEGAFFAKDGQAASLAAGCAELCPNLHMGFFGLGRDVLNHFHIAGKIFRQGEKRLVFFFNQFIGGLVCAVVANVLIALLDTSGRRM